MKTSAIHRLSNHLQKAVLERKSVIGNILSSTYDEFSDHLAFLAGSRLFIPEGLRYLRHMETKLGTCMNVAGSRVDGQTHIYLMRASGLIKTEIELSHFALRHPRCRNALTDTGKEQITPFSLRWRGSLVNLVELVVSLYYLRMMTDGSGNRQSFALLMAVFGEFLHIQAPKPYDLCADLARRKESPPVLFPKLREVFKKNTISYGIRDE